MIENVRESVILKAEGGWGHLFLPEQPALILQQWLLELSTLKERFIL